MADSKRLDVYRNQFPAQVRPVARTMGNDIYCDLTEDFSTVDDEQVVCALEEMVIDADYTRVFFAATVADTYNVIPSGWGGETPFGMTLQIRDDLTGIRVVPRVGNNQGEHVPVTITGSLDLPIGTYHWLLDMFAVYTLDGFNVGCAEASLSAIVGQHVPEQQCWKTWGCGG